MRPNTVSDFWENVRKTRGCWWWERATDGDGYGLFHWKGRMIRATRFMAKVIMGRDIEGKVVRHTCDNPSCVNPSHLLVGTHKDNAEDRDTRGRGVKGRSQSQDHVAKRAAARRGKKWTQAMKDAMSARKKVTSPETRTKMSEARKRWYARLRLDDS